MSEPFFKESDQDGFIPKQLSVDGRDSGPAFTIAKANRLLRERSQLVYFPDFSDGTAYFTKDKSDSDTHRALLVCVEPLISDSAEKIVEDLACFAPGGDVEQRNKHSLCELADRAKKLRGGK